ncbi:MAG: thioredoxin domain-containing protein [Candidatus Nanoarchaeia archaeon]
MEDIHSPNIKPEEHKPETKTTTVIVKQSLLWQIISIVLLIVLVASIWTGGFGLREPTGAVANVPEQNEPERVKVSVDDDAVLGDEDAPVTIIEFSDFQCPYCARFVLNTLPEIKEKYIDTGKVKLVFRDFPLRFHANAANAALAAECAEDKYFEMHDKLFAGQADWASAEDPKSVFRGYAKDLGIDATKWETCYGSKKYAEENSKDFSDGSAAGVSGTPTFFIGNDKDGYIKVVGALPYDAFKQAIDAELA